MFLLEKGRRDLPIESLNLQNIVENKQSFTVESNPFFLETPRPRSRLSPKLKYREKSRAPTPSEPGKQVDAATETTSPFSKGFALLVFALGLLLCALGLAIFILKSRAK